MEQQRFNLWVTSYDPVDDATVSKIVCFGSQPEMNDLALQAGLPGDAHVLPDGHEPNNQPTV